MTGTLVDWGISVLNGELAYVELGSFELIMNCFVLEATLQPQGACGEG